MEARKLRTPLSESLHDQWVIDALTVGHVVSASFWILCGSIWVSAIIYARRRGEPITKENWIITATFLPLLFATAADYCALLFSVHTSNHSALAITTLVSAFLNAANGIVWGFYGKRIMSGELNDKQILAHYDRLKDHIND
jgi:hypothetical protein